MHARGLNVALSLDVASFLKKRPKRIPARWRNGHQPLQLRVPRCFFDIVVPDWWTLSAQASKAVGRGTSLEAAREFVGEIKATCRDLGMKDALFCRPHDFNLSSFDFTLHSAFICSRW